MLIGPRLTWVEMNALSFDFCSPRTADSADFPHGRSGLLKRFF